MVKSQVGLLSHHCSTDGQVHKDSTITSNQNEAFNQVKKTVTGNYNYVTVNIVRSKNMQEKVINQYTVFSLSSNKAQGASYRVKGEMNSWDMGLLQA